MNGSKGTVVILAMVGVLAAALGIGYLRSTPSITSTAEQTKVSPTAAMPPLPASLPTQSVNEPVAVNRLEPTAPAPITVRCGDAVMTVQTASPADTRAVSVDCNQVNQSIQPAPEVVTAQPVVYRTVRRRARVQRVNNYYYDEPGYYNDGYRERPYYHKKRSWQKEALIIGGSAGAGTAIGAIAGGKKGAGIGALTGGVAGLVYDLTTRNK